MSKWDFLDQKDGNAVYDSVGVALFADEFAGRFSEGRPVARADDELQ